LYIYVQNAEDKLTNPLTSNNYTELLILIFPNWTIQNVWFGRRIRIRSSL